MKCRRDRAAIEEALPTLSRGLEERERLAAERREREERERLAAEKRQRDEQERLAAEKRRRDALKWLDRLNGLGVGKNIRFSHRKLADLLKFQARSNLRLGEICGF